MKNMFAKSVCVLSLAMISSLLFADGTAISSEDSGVFTFSNASGSAAASENVINTAYYDFYIPPSEGLPVGSVVKIKSISLSGFNSSYVAAKSDSAWADSAFVKLNGVRSDPVNGGTVSSSQYSGGVWDETIASGAGVNGTLLKYEFSSDCLIVVGKQYPASVNGNQGGIGDGITLFHANGKANGSGGNNFQSDTAVRFIKTDDANSFISFSGSKSDGLYPVYSIDLEVVNESVMWTGSGSDNKMSNPDNWSTREVPGDGAVIGIDSGNAPVTIEADIPIDIEHLVAHGENTITFTGFGENKFRVAEIVTEAPIIANGTTFCPQSVILGTNGSLAIDEQGFLSDITFSYEGALPEIGDKFTSTTIDSDVTNAERWGGTVWLKNVRVSDFNPNNYGHGGTESLPASTVKLSGIIGYFPKVLQVQPELELANDKYSYGLNIDNGYSRNASNRDNIIVIEKLKGDGEFWTSNSDATTVLVNIKDYADFSGSVQLVKQIVVLGSNIPAVEEHNVSGSIYIGTNVVATIPSNKQWRADGGIHVKGELKVADAINEIIRSGTRVITYDTGVVTLTGVTGNRWNFDYSRIEGTGALCFAGTSWCSLTTNNTISTSLTVKNEQPGGLVVPPYTPLPDGEKNYICEIGSLSGSGSFRGDYDWNSGENAIRTLRIKQSKDTEWSGIVGDGAARIAKISVAPGESNAGTLTLSGTAQNSVALEVEANAKINITGKWKGNVTVSSGSVLSGTGTIEGNLTLNDGAVLRANDESETPLTINGSVTSSENATVTIEIPEGKTTRRFVLITANSGLSNINFVCTNSAYSVRVTDTSVTVSRKGFSVIVR